MAATGEPMCEPVHVTARALPYFDGPPDTLDTCVAAEAECGKGTVRTLKEFGVSGESILARDTYEINCWCTECQ